MRRQPTPGSFLVRSAPRGYRAHMSQGTQRDPHTATPVGGPARRGDATPSAGARTLAWAVLGAALLQVLAPVVTIAGPGSSPGQGSGPDLLITPVGWAFSIWGVIYALAIAQAIAVLRAGAAGTPRRLQLDQVALYLGGTLWIALAGLDSSLATALALAVMLAAAADGVLTATRHALAPTWLATLTRASIGLYAGWVTAAFFLNVSTALVDADLVEVDVLAWQVVVLVAAATTLLVLVVATRGSLAFTAAGTWAMVGIAVTGAGDGTTTVVLVCVVAAVALIATSLVTQARLRASADAVSRGRAPLGS